MAIPRTTLILLIVLVVVLLGGGTWYWLNRDSLGPDTTSNTNTTTTNTRVVNTNSAANINATLSNEIKGDKEINGKASVGGVEVTFSSATKSKTYAGEQAADKKLFVLIFFEPVPSKQVLAVNSGFENNHRLVTNKGNAAEAGLKVASDIIKGDRGFLKYLVDETATSFSLEIGGVDNPQRIPLPL